MLAFTSLLLTSVCYQLLTTQQLNKIRSFVQSSVCNLRDLPTIEGYQSLALSVKPSILVQACLIADLTSMISFIDPFLHRVSLASFGLSHSIELSPIRSCFIGLKRGLQFWDYRMCIKRLSNLWQVSTHVHIF